MIVVNISRSAKVPRFAGRIPFSATDAAYDARTSLNRVVGYA